MRIKVRFEEVLIGCVLGAAAGVAITSPLTAGIVSYWPHAGGGFWPAFQAALVLIAGGIGALAGGLLAANQNDEQHIRGVRFEADPLRAARFLQVGERSEFSSAQRSGEIRGVTIGGVEFSRTREVGHLYCVGLPGSGKTVVLRSLIDQAIARGDRTVVHDPKGDLTAAYYNEETTVLLGPWDSRAALWDIASDVDSPALADEFAAAVCRVAEAGQNRYFHEGAARVLSGLIKSYQAEGNCGWTWAQIGDVLAGELPVLVTRAATGDPLVRALFAGTMNGQPGKSEDAIISTLASAAGWIRQIAEVDRDAAADAPRFSIRRWLGGQAHSSIRLLLLNSNANYESAGAAIFGSILAVAAAVVASASMAERNADEPGTWLILDEFPQLGAEAMRHIQRLAEIGRSRGVREVLALQDESQIEAVMGREKHGPVLNMQGSRIYLRTSASTADAVSKRIGEREILLIESTATSGAVGGKTMRPAKRAVLNQSDLLGLHRTDAGIELLLHIEDRIGRLLQPFAARRPPLAEAFQESRAWRMGGLASCSASEGAVGSGAAPAAVHEAVSSLCDDDFPFGLAGVSLISDVATDTCGDPHEVKPFTFDDF